MIYKAKAYLTLAVCSVIPSIGCANNPLPPAELNLNLPAGFEATLFAKLGSASPRMLAFNQQGQLFVTAGRNNAVLMLPDTNKDGVAEAPVLVSNALNSPNGLVFVGNDLLVANQDGVVRLSQKNGIWSAPQPFIRHLPTGGHTVKTIKISPDKHLYINVGSSCNVCIENDPARATLLRYTLEGKPAGALEVLGRHSLAPIWARGLRNSQGFAWHPQTGDMFATNNGADMRAATKNGKVNDDLPPEHLNKIEPSKHYGWPHCWGNQFEDPNFVGADHFCKSTTAPAITMTAHSTPIGITFLAQSHFPAEYKNDAIIALHGSWNREQLSGYKLVRVKFEGGKPVGVVDFATGWLNNNQAWGRPVDVAIGHDGALYVSDDHAGYIYRIRYKKP
ncbi:MAG: PQQ-dependent sugar dehydrogenase [Methylophilaceae bacterium]